MNNLEHNPGPAFGQELRYLARVAGIAIVLFAILYGGIVLWKQRHPGAEKITVRAFPEGEDQLALLRECFGVKPEAASRGYVEFRASFRDLLDLLRRGVPAAAVVEVAPADSVPGFYPDYEAILARVDSLVSLRPGLAKKVVIGHSAFGHRPIVAVRLGAAGKAWPDRPSVLFMGVHHAREPVGAFVCLGILRDLMLHAQENRVRRWLDELNIWIVPVINPDGLDYVIHQARTFPWWRKNLHDNNRDGRFEPELDGVDLNRNYDFNWSNGGSGRSFTWFYRGAGPASEPEVQAVARLAEEEHFVLAVDYHSFGQMVMFPWAKELKPPDLLLLRQLAEELASRLPREDGKGHYRTIPLDGQAGQSANFLYARYRTAAFIVEVGEKYFPDRPVLQKLVAAQVKGARFLLDRALGAGLSGHVRDAADGHPLPAMVQAGEDFSPVVAPTTCRRSSGYFHRLLLPGRYDVTVMMDGYASKEIPGVEVPSGRPAKLEVKLRRLGSN